MSDDSYSFESITKWLGGVVDGVTSGLSAWYEGELAVTEAQARIAQAKADKRNADTIANYGQGAGYEPWGNTGGGFNLNMGNSQGLLIAAGLGLAVFAVMRST